MGLPCGMASRARERPVSEKLQAMGVPNPPPLRSATCPLGLPQLSPFHRAKVESANRLYRLAVEILVYCYKRNIVVSIENPANSWLWAALVRITADLSIEASHVLNSLEKVEFHACCHGPTRRKNTGWLGTPQVFSKLAAVCQYDHPHDTWGVHLTPLVGILIRPRKRPIHLSLLRGLSNAWYKYVRLEMSALPSRSASMTFLQLLWETNLNDTNRWYLSITIL